MCAIMQCDDGCSSCGDSSSMQAMERKDTRSAGAGTWATVRKISGLPGADGASRPVLQQHTESELMWKNDVGERYKQLVPPRPARQGARLTSCSLSSGPLISEMLGDAVAKASLSSQPGGKCVDEVVMFLDLDKAAIFGNDGNDFGIALQWENKPFSDVVALYKLLVNPNVKETYRALSARAKHVKVVLYTMRSTLLVYNSPFRHSESIIPVRWHPNWHVDGQLYLPPDLVTSDQVMSQTHWQHELMEPELLDIKKSLERLLAVREVIQSELGLNELPHVVVTATGKSVRQTAEVLGMKPANCYLWDDNTKIEQNEHVVRVAPYVAMTPPRRDALLKFLDRKLPALDLDEDLLEFLLGAPACDAALLCDSSGAVNYHVACATELEPWALPPSTGVWAQVARVDANMRLAAADVASAVHAAAGKDKMDMQQGQESGSLSPVTPDALATPPRADTKLKHHKGRITASTSAPNLLLPRQQSVRASFTRLSAASVVAVGCADR